VTNWRVRSRTIAAAAGALLVVAATAVAFSIRDTDHSGRPPGERPELLLLTSLPILFPEGFSLDAPPVAVRDALESRYELVPVGTTDAASLTGHRLLLMAQPNAQPAESLVALDRWVREGGRAVLLADPRLDWPSTLPLGDVSRPAATFPDTGLLLRWGLRLEAPDEPAAAQLRLGTSRVRTASPGKLAAAGGGCEIAEGAALARCRVGKGNVTVIADSDFLDTRRFGEGNVELLLAELERLER